MDHPLLNVRGNKKIHCIPDAKNFYRFIYPACIWFFYSGIIKKISATTESCLDIFRDLHMKKNITI